MTLRMYADSKNWPLENVAVRLKHSRIHAKDCGDCDSKEGRVDEIRLVLDLSGPLSLDQRNHLLEIAGKCPVHRTLTSETKIRTSMNS